MLVEVNGTLLEKEALMARLNVALLIMQATEVADRAAFVCRDPAVVKVAKEAGADIAQAGRSAYALIREARSAWTRSDARSRSTHN